MIIEEENTEVTGGTEDTGAAENTEESFETDVDTSDYTDSQSTAGENSETDGQGETEPADYVPNPIFKVHNEERQFDDFALSMIKDKETEDKFRELYERSAGLDPLKEDRQFLREENSKQKAQTTEFDKVKGDLARLGHYIRNNDLGSFMEEHGLTDEQIANYLIQKQEVSQDPAALARYNAQRQQVAQTYTLEQRNLMLENQLRQQQDAQFNQVVQNRQQELHNVISDPTLSSQVQSFDARMGEGAFQREVIARGQMHYQQTKQDLTPQEAVNQVAQLAGFSLSQGAPQQNYPVQNMNESRPAFNAPQMRGQQQGGQNPVIPNISGSNTTPVKRIPTSIQELRDMHQASIS